MHDATWLQADATDAEEPTGRARRTWVVLLLAAVPWLVVVALLVLPGRLGGVNGGPGTDLTATAPPVDAPGDGAFVADGRGTSDTDEPIGTGAGSDATAAPLPPSGVDTPDAPRDPVTLDLTEYRGDWRVTPGLEEAAGLAVVVARAWLTGLDPTLDLPGLERPPGASYAEHLVVEAVEMPAPGAAVVTLLAVVLDGGSALEAGVRRLAVPIAFDADGPQPAGHPWVLPGPQLEVAAPTRQPIEDEAELLAIQDALVAAGLSEPELVDAAATDGWPVIAEVRLDEGSTTTEVWLRPHVGGYVVAGTTLSTAAPPTTGTPTGGGRGAAGAKDGR